jgi:hypothetical protein
MDKSNGFIGMVNSFCAYFGNNGSAIIDALALSIQKDTDSSLALVVTLLLALPTFYSVYITQMKNHPLRAAMLFWSRVFVWLIVGLTGISAVLFAVKAPCILLLWLVICIASLVGAGILGIGVIRSYSMTKEIKKAMSDTNPLKIFS